MNNKPYQAIFSNNIFSSIDIPAGYLRTFIQLALAQNYSSIAKCYSYILKSVQIPFFCLQQLLLFRRLFSFSVQALIF